MSQIAAGQYHYLRGGDLQPIEEHWSITQQDSQKTVIAQRTFETAHIECRAESAHNAITAAHVMFRSGDHVVRADYDLIANRYTRTQGSQSPVTLPLELPPNTVIMPIFRIFTGSVIRQIIAQGGEASVMVPNIVNPADHDSVLHPLIETRRAAVLTQETVEIDGVPIMADCCTYTSAQYDEHARFWIDGHDVLLRYTFNEWDVRLMAYVRR
jgi:hypothetical protein